MKKLILGLCALCVLSACDEIKGTSVVTQTLTAKDKKGRHMTIKPGTYKTEFGYDENDRELNIKIKKSNEQGKDVKLKLMLPSDVTLPRDNGSFALMANQIGQTWNLEGQIDTQVRDSETTRTTESCSIETQEYVCHETCDPDGCNCSTSCGYETVYVPGVQDVEYYFTTTTKNVHTQFKDASSDAEQSRFEGSDTHSVKNYTYIGTCL